MFSDGIRGTPGFWPSRIGLGNKRRSSSWLRNIAVETSGRSWNWPAIAADISLDSVLNLGLEPERGPAVQGGLHPSVSARRYPVARWRNRTNGLMDLRTESRESTSRCSCATASTPGSGWGSSSYCQARPHRLAESSTQTGWDAVIENQDGSTDEHSSSSRPPNLWVTSRKPLMKHPDIRVVVPTEVDDRADDILGYRHLK